MKKLLASALLLLGLSTPAFSEDKNGWWPDFGVAQNGAYNGYMSLGVGSDIGERGAWELLYGYTPESLGGHDIHSFNLKSYAYLFQRSRTDSWWMSPYIGIGVLYSPDPDLFVLLPDQYSPGYYPPSAIHLGLHAGIELKVERQLGIYVEYAVLDYEFPHIANFRRFDRDAVGSGGIGIRYHFMP